MSCSASSQGKGVLGSKGAVHWKLASDWSFIQKRGYGRLVKLLLYIPAYTNVAGRPIYMYLSKKIGCVELRENTHLSNVILDSELDSPHRQARPFSAVNTMVWHATVDVVLHSSLLRSIR